jgi:hypothetical protein
VVVGEEGLAGLGGGEPVAPDQLLQFQCHLAQAPRLGGGPLLPPLLVPPVEEVALDDGDEVRPELRVALELLQDAVIVLQELDVDRLPEVLGLRAAEEIPAADEGGRPVDQREVRLVELFGGHGVAPRPMGLSPGSSCRAVVWRGDSTEEFEFFGNPRSRAVQAEGRDAAEIYADTQGSLDLGISAKPGRAWYAPNIRPIETRRQPSVHRT